MINHATHCPSCHQLLPWGTVPRPLTKRQAEIYRYIATYARAHGYAPSFNEIAAEFRFASLATVHEHLSNLEAKRVIRRGFNETRSIECLVPLDKLGEVKT
jgi:repressor LexA